MTQGLFEDQQKIDAPTMDMHRALTLLAAEITSIDSHNQHYDACTDPELRLVIAHHRERKKALVAMLLEWVRRRDVRFDKEMKHALFKAGPITAPYQIPEEENG